MPQSLKRETPPLLCMCNIRKQYPGVLALDDVSFELRSGEVHCLIGENGAGKSTLIKILSGAVQKNSGEIVVDGKSVGLYSPAEVQRLGIGIIHQEFKLVPELSVAENILLGNEPQKKGLPFIDVDRMHSIARASLSQLGEEIDTRAPISSLSIAERQLVEIAKALSKNIRILAMDEPSAALTDKELENLFKVIRRLKTEGVGIIYISHRLEEIFEIGDQVTILRDGRCIHTCPINEIDRPGLIRHMVGRELEKEFPTAELERGKEILRIRNLSAGMLRDINLTLHRGEVLGLAGLVGAGRTELARVVFGADPKDSGEIFLDQKPIHPRSPREAIDLGIGLLTEDRNKYGLVMQMNVRENISLSNLHDVVRGPFVNRAKENEVARQFSDNLRIKTPSIEQEVEVLSGGNRQKVVLARWLFTESKVLIFDEPTAGIDVGVKLEIYNLINNLAQKGIGVLVISSELSELLGMCTRIAVMHEGRIVGVLDRNEATQEKVMTLATGGA
ncbi:MAG TPA: D-xylose ABC transporter ATP-binding protein [Bacteroidetes bacterium]|nr:D-xylose ABC transporter ATP-binding protein [Bacteroidota bacterium]